MNENRAKAGNLCMSDAMPFCQHHTYRTGLALVDCLHNAFFLPVRGNLRDGDRITFCRFETIDKTSQEKLIEVAEVRVLSCEDKAVNIAIVGEIVSFEHARAELEAEPEPDEKYVLGDGKVKYNSRTHRHEVIVDGEVVHVAADKDEAIAVARGDKALAA